MNEPLMFDLLMDYFDESTGEDEYSISQHYECDSYTDLYDHVRELERAGFYNISVYDCSRGCDIDVY